MVIVKNIKNEGFIREAIIKDILNRADIIRETLKCNTFVWLDNPMPNAKLMNPEVQHYKLEYINRIGHEKLYYRSDIKPMEWDSLQNRKLYLIWKRLKHNKAFVYKDISGKLMKVKVKNEIAKKS